MALLAKQAALQFCDSCSVCTSIFPAAWWPTSMIWRYVQGRLSCSCGLSMMWVFEYETIVWIISQQSLTRSHNLTSIIFWMIASPTSNLSCTAASSFGQNLQLDSDLCFNTPLASTCLCACLSFVCYWHITGLSMLCTLSLLAIIDLSE